MVNNWPENVLSIRERECQLVGVQVPKYGSLLVFYFGPGSRVQVQVPDPHGFWLMSVQVGDFCVVGDLLH